MKLVVALVLVAAAMSACAPKDFAKEGSDAEQFTKDEAQCRTQVRARAQQERNIDDTRRATFASERERYGQQGLYTDMANQGYKFNTERMMANCMEARGWAPKQNGPIPMPKLTW